MPTETLSQSPYVTAARWPTVAHPAQGRLLTSHAHISWSAILPLISAGGKFHKVGCEKRGSREPHEARKVRQRLQQLALDRIIQSFDIKRAQCVVTPHAQLGLLFSPSKRHNTVAACGNPPLHRRALRQKKEDPQNLFGSHAKTVTVQTTESSGTLDFLNMINGSLSLFGLAPTFSSRRAYSALSPVRYMWRYGAGHPHHHHCFRR